MVQSAAPLVDQASGWVSADPYAVRFAALGSRSDPAEALRLAIRLPASRTIASAETFVLTLMSASSRRTLWSLRHAPTYWRIAPLDIQVFRLCQATMASLRMAKARAQWLITSSSSAETSSAVSLYFQQAPDAPFVLLSSHAAYLEEEAWLSCAD